MNPVESSSGTKPPVARRPSEPPKAKESAESSAPAATPPETSSPPAAAAPPTAKARDLGSSAPAQSNPTASKELVRRQASVAGGLTATSSFRTAPVRAEIDPGVPEAEGTEPSFSDPLEQEQRSDLKPPEALRPGGPIPEIPDLKGQKALTEEKQVDGSVERTYKSDGVEYTVIRGRLDSVITTFEKDGVTYTKTEGDDGNDKFAMELETEKGLYDREILTDGKGQVTERSYSRQYPYQSSTGVQQSREVVVGPDGTRTVRENVTGTDGGKSDFTRVVRANGTSTEAYNYDLGDTKVRRTTERARDGSSETRKEKAYTTSTPLESLVQAPEVPEWGRVGPTDLPKDDRGSTQVSDVEVTTTDSKGREELQYSEESYAQTSTDVEVDPERSTFAFRPDGSVTRTITVVKARDEEGNLVESSAGSQETRLEGETRSGPVSLANRVTWNSSGDNSYVFDAKGFQGRDLADLLYANEQLPPLRVGEQESSIFPTGIALEYDAFGQLGKNSDGQEWLGVDGRNPSTDFSHEVHFDADGRTVSETSTFGPLQSNGDGRTVSVSRDGPDAPRVWRYSDVKNGGEDFRRQTVVEGTEISSFEERTTDGPGQFAYTSETLEGGRLISSSKVSRDEVTSEEIGQAVEDGLITPEQARGVLAGPEPYVWEYSDSLEEQLLDEEGNLRLDADKKPIQPGSQELTSRLSNAGGYQAAESDQSGVDEEGNLSGSHLSTVTDPSGRPPFRGTLETSSPGSAEREVTNLAINNKGELLSDGVEVGQFDLEGADLKGFLSEAGSIDPLLNGIFKTLRGAPAGLFRGAGTKIPGTNIPKYPKLELDKGTYSRLTKGLDVFGTVLGAAEIFKGLSGEDDYKQVATGAGLVAWGGASAISALGALEGKTGALGAVSKVAALKSVGNFGKHVLGPLGATVGLGLGVNDFFHADTGQERTAAGLSAASGAVALAGLPFGPPGWIIGGIASGALSIASYFVGREGYVSPSHLESLDERLE